MDGVTFDNSNKETQDALMWFSENTYICDDKLFWKNKSSSGRARSSVYAGKQCGCLSKRGYIQVRMGKEKFMAHRIIWAMTYGSWPIGGIDHIDGDKTNNRIENLRDTTQFENSKNAAKYPRKEPWIATGVIRHNNKFKASAQVDNVKVYIGLYNCHTAAMIARKLFDVGKGFSDRHGKPAHDGLWRE